MKKYLIQISVSIIAISSIFLFGSISSKADTTGKLEINNQIIYENSSSKMMNKSDQDIRIEDLFLPNKSLLQRKYQQAKNAPFVQAKKGAFLGKDKFTVSESYILDINHQLFQSNKQLESTLSNSTTAKTPSRFPLFIYCSLYFIIGSFCLGLGGYAGGKFAKKRMHSEDRKDKDEK